MKRSRQVGISLLEIMVTITIFSILTAVAAPGVRDLINNNRARALNNEFTSSLYQARSEAVKRGNKVTLCATNDAQTACLTSAQDFSKGWMVFTDYNNNGQFNPDHQADTTGDGINNAHEEILSISGTPPTGYKIKTTVNSLALRNRLTYHANGLPDMGVGLGYQLLEADVGGKGDTQLARIAISMTGRIRSCVGGLDKCPKP